MELKNKPALWHRAKRVVIQPGQTEVRVDFPLPVVACNLQIEYADFYENLQVCTMLFFCWVGCCCVSLVSASSWVGGADLWMSPRC